MSCSKAICLFLLFYCSFTVSCSSGSSDDSQSSSSISEEALTNFSSRCGLYEKGELVSIPSQSELVSAEILEPDTVIITRQVGEEAGNKELVKFHGLSSSGINNFRRLHGIEVLNKKLRGGAHFIPAGKNCNVEFGSGGAGVLGQLYTFGGESINELMLSQGTAMPMADACGGEVLSFCYRSIPLVARPPSEVELDPLSVKLSSQCGGVYQGRLVNPILKAELVKVEAVSTSQVIVTRVRGLEAGNPQLVKLHGLTSVGLTNTAKTQGSNYLKTNLANEVYLAVESLECEVQVDGGGIGVVGQLYTKDGKNLNEELLKLGYARPTSDSCGGELLSSCYQQISSAAPIIQDPVISPPRSEDEDSGDSDSDDGDEENLIKNFLWKPVSDSNGNLAVLVNPRRVRIVVSGLFDETLVDKGPSNGRGTTSRGKRPGCDFGENVTVSFFNSSGDAIPVAGGGTTVNVADGCKRFEFKR